MKSMKKTLTLLLALVLLVSLLAGCASKGQTDTKAPDAETPDTTDTADTAAGGAEDSAATPPASGVSESSYLPLVDEPTTITGWVAMDIRYDPSLKLSETPGYKWMADQTGVTVDWTTVAGSANTEQFNLMLVAQEYPDYIHNSSTAYAGGLEKAIEQEVIIDITPYVEQGLAPHYEAIREADEDVRRDTMLDSGALPGFFRILTYPQSSFIGWTVASDVAEELGFHLDECVTVDDYYNLVKAFADYGMETPCELVTNGFDTSLMATYGLGGAFFGGSVFRQVGGQVEYSLITDDYYEYLKTMKKWYDDGLFNKDFYGVTGSIALNNDMIAAGGVGIFNMLASQGQMISDLSGHKYVAVPAPLRFEGDTRKIAQNGGCAARAETALSAITTACEDVELVVRYLDFYFSDEAFDHLNYGIEGESYELDADGNPRYTEQFINDSQGWVSQMQHFACYNSSTFLFKWDTQKEGMPDAVIYAYNTWDKYYDGQYNLPTLSMTAAESERYSDRYSDISTYASEMVLKFILGNEPLTEESYAAYVKKIQDMGIQDCVDVYQSAYDRYLAR